MTQDYSKTVEPELVDWMEALAQMRNGFCIRRKGWPPSDFMVWVRSATFTAMDYTTGAVDDFMVRRCGLRDCVVMPDFDDLKAQDWQVYSRQQTHSFPRIPDRHTRSLEPPPAALTVSASEA